MRDKKIFYLCNCIIYIFAINDDEPELLSSSKKQQQHYTDGEIEDSHHFLVARNIMQFDRVC